MNAGVLLSLVLVGFSDTPLRMSASRRPASAVPSLVWRGDDDADNGAELVGGGGGGGAGPPHSPELKTVITDRFACNCTVEMSHRSHTNDCPSANEIAN